jgi:hypothetical protein
VSADRGDTYLTRFARNDVIDLMGTIVVEKAHIGQAGRLVALVELSNGTSLAWGSNGFFPWDGSVEGLLSAATPKALAAANEIYPLEGFSLLEFGLENADVVFFLGYAIASNPSEIYYSTTPINFRVD